MKVETKADKAMKITTIDYIDFKSILNSKDKIKLIVGRRGQGKSQAYLLNQRK